MSHQCISIREHYDGRVLEITLGPPPGNIVTMALLEELSAELDNVDNGARKLVVLTGEGKHFSFGASVEEHRADQVAAMLPRFHATIRKLLTCDIPTMAKVSGMCLGGGFELALACGMIACDKGAKLGVPEIKLGVFPPVAAVLLGCNVGDAFANEIILTGEAYPAETAWRMGIVNLVAADESLDDLVNGFIEKHILPKSASSLRLAFRVARERVREHYDQHIAAAEKLYLEELMSTADAVEGIEAFLAKREPKWVDR
jgi:cyclohexa-1,5-dienecarbonyl-CoA hydratase